MRLSCQQRIVDNLSRRGSGCNLICFPGFPTKFPPRPADKHKQLIHIYGPPPVQPNILCIQNLTFEHHNNTHNRQTLLRLFEFLYVFIPPFNLLRTSKGRLATCR